MAAVKFRPRIFSPVRACLARCPTVTALCIFLQLGAVFTAQRTTAAQAPDAGQAQQSIESAPLSLPAPQHLHLTLPDTRHSSGITAPDGVSVQVSQFTVSGNEAIPSGELLSLLTEFENRTLTASQLQDAAQILANLYRQRGYLLARTYLPPQEIASGIVAIVVIEGRYGTVQLANQSRSSDATLNGFLAPLQTDDAVHAKRLERSLLLLSDLPGVEVTSTLKPGTQPGTSDLLVETNDTPLLSGSVDADNHGNRFTGEFRLGANLFLDSPLRRGDQFSLRAMGSDENQQYFRAVYQLPVGGEGTRLGAAWSDLDYQLARNFADLDATGNAQIASLWLSHPLIRSRTLNLTAQLQFDSKALEDEVGLLDTRTTRDSRNWSATLSGVNTDQLAAGGVTSFALALTRGDLEPGREDEALDSTTARTAGDFIRIHSMLARLQQLDERFSLYTRVQAQWSDSNLHSSEKFSLGGAYGVRAYPEGEGYGDEGWLANIELRRDLADTWQISTFLDHGEVRFNQSPWQPGDNRQHLSAMGLGLRWQADGWYVDASSAWRIGNTDPESDAHRSPRIWVQLLREF